MEFSSIEEKVIYNKLIQPEATKKVDVLVEERIQPTATQEVQTIDADGYFSEISRRISVMEETRDNALNIYVERQTIAHPIRWAKYCFKRLVRKCTMWSVGPYFNRQTNFNNMVVPSIGRLTELTSAVINGNNQQTARINHLDSFTSTVEGRMAVMEAKTEGNEKDIQQLQNQTTSLEDETSQLRERMTDLERALEDRTGHLGERITSVERVLEDRTSHLGERVIGLRTDLESRTTNLGDRLTNLLNRLDVDERMMAFLDQKSVTREQLAALEGRVAITEQTFAKTEWLSTLQFRMDAMEDTAVRTERIKPLEEKMQMIEQWYKTSASMMHSLETKIGFMEEQGLLKSVEKAESKEEQNNISRRTLSQSGEDCILSYIVRVLGIPENKCTYLDLGANHAKQYSNTYYFYNKGARGVLIEANPALIPELKLYRSDDVVVNCCISDRAGETVDFYVLNGDGLSTPDKERVDEVLALNPALKVDRVVPVVTMTVNQILDTYFDKAPIYMNIDLEGDDLAILSSIDWDVHRPLMVSIEMIPYKPHLVIGEKNKNILAFMDSVDYIEYAFTGINSIFLDKRQIKDVL